MEKQITPKNPTYEEKKYAGHVNPSYMQPTHRAYRIKVN
jgi:hypothetical protein